MTATPRVTVCVPTRNRAEYLREAIESVLGQTFSDFELLVCDNASTDATSSAVEGFRDSRIRYIRHRSNIGMAGNWRHAVDAAGGTYCGILSDDDRWDRAFLERLIAPLEDDDRVDVAFCDHWIMSAEGHVLRDASDECSRRFRGDLRPGLHRPFWELALHHQALLPTAALIRRERLVATRAFDIVPDVLPAYYVFGRLALAGGGAFYVSERLAYYRTHSNSASETVPIEAWRALQWACGRLAAEAPSRPVASWIRASWVEALAGEGVLLLRRDQRRGAALAFWRAARLAPYRMGLWVRLIVSILGLYHGSRALATRVRTLLDRSRPAVEPPPRSP